MNKIMNSIVSFVVMCIVFSSCTNDLSNNDADPYIDENIPVYNTLEELLGVSELKNVSDNEVAIETKGATYIPWTAFGYDEKKINSQNKKGQFGAELAQILGVSVYTVYIFDIYNVIKRVNIGDVPVKQLDSPKCGLLPMDSNNRIGYVATQMGNDYQMTTWLVHIKTDMSGRQLNKWGPRTPETVEWNYGLYDLGN